MPFGKCVFEGIRIHYAFTLLNNGGGKYENEVFAACAFPGPTLNYGALDAGQVSEYKLFEEVYHYGFIEVEAEDSTYRLVPTDFVGESPLKPGQYTYEVKIKGDDLMFRFVE